MPKRTRVSKIKIAEESQGSRLAIAQIQQNRTATKMKGNGAHPKKTNRIMQNATRLVKSCMKRMGIICIKSSSQAFLAEEEIYHILADLINNNNPIIIDGGSHKGGAVDQLRSFFPDAQFHCFEPDPELAMALKLKYSNNKKVTIIQKAIGEKGGKGYLNINSAKATNSLLDPVENLDPDLDQLCKQVTQTEVDITSIDEYCRSNIIEHVDLLKLDLQGYDYLALRGAKSTLNGVNCVLVEIIFSKIYKNNGGFREILNLMEELEFEMHTLGGLRYGKDSRLLWGDAIFTRKT